MPGYLRQLLVPGQRHGPADRLGQDTDVHGSRPEASAPPQVRDRDGADLRLDEKPWGTIRWAADRDKIGRETTTPIGPDVRAVLNEITNARPGAGRVPLFPAPEDPTKPVDKYSTGKLLTRGIALAKRKAKEDGRTFEPPPQWGYHSFRRKFATELKGAPDKDVADLGGWKDLNTTREFYQMADHDSMVAALTSRIELRNRKAQR